MGHSPLIYDFNEFDISPFIFASADRRKYKKTGGRIAAHILMQNRRALRLAREQADDDFFERLRWTGTSLAIYAIFHSGFFGLCSTSQLHGLIDLSCQIGAGKKTRPNPPPAVCANNGATALRQLV
jgi:hypothetical protein